MGTTEFKVGIFFAVVFVIIVWMFERVDDAPETSGKWRTHYVYFDDATGLIDKTPVETAGIRVGFIRSIELDLDKAKVILAIDPQVVLHRDAVVTIRDRGILGEKYLNIIPGSKNKRVLGDLEVIRNAISKSDMAAAFEKFEGIAEYIESITKSLDTIIKEGISTDTIKNLLTNLEAITVNIQGVVKTLENTVRNSDRKFDNITTSLDNFTRDLVVLFRENNDNITRTIKNLEAISSHANAMFKNNDEKIRSGFENISTISERLKTIADTIDNMVGQVAEGKGVVGKLIADEQTGEQLTQAIEGVNEFLDRTRKLSTGIGYRGEMLADEREIQNVVQITLRPRPDKYFLLEFVDSPSFGDLKVTQTEWQIEGSEAQSTKLIEKTSDDDLTFSLQFCKTLYNMTFRFGLVRSEGGFALDYHLFDKKLTFTFEAFDFARIDRPHLRSLLSFSIYQQLLITAGVDDMINNNPDKHIFYNGFVGFGLSFTDDDLKTVISSLPTPSF